MSVFVTVGSTSFDDLIKTLCSEECLEILKSNRFEKIVFQIGRGSFIPPESSKLKIEWFRFKDNLTDDIKNASLIIGHAGAGTILECLFEYKPLLVVVNEKLMNNHQGELAEKLSTEGYLKYCSCSQLRDTLRKCDFNNFVKSSFKCQNDVFIEVLEYNLGLK